MKVGIPSEIKNNEFRVAITPAGVYEFARAGHEVYVQAGAGAGSSISDADFVAAGATILPGADDVWAHRPTWSSRSRSRSPRSTRGCATGQVLFTYLHLAASKECTDALIDRKVTGIAYETVRAAGPLAAAARPDVRGRRPARPAGRRVPPDALRRRPRRADGRRPRRVRGQGRGDRRRRLRHERRRHRARHAGRGAGAGQATSPGCAPPTPTTAATCRPSRPTPTRSRRPSSTPTW